MFEHFSSGSPEETSRPTGRFYVLGIHGLKDFIPLHLVGMNIEMIVLTESNLIGIDSIP